MAPRIALVPDPHGPGGRLLPLDDAGAPLGPPAAVADLAAAVAEREAAEHPRWVWAAADSAYAPLLPRLPDRLARRHDLRLTEALLLAYEHSLVKAGDLSKLDAAFFTMNGIISLLLFAFVLAGRLYVAWAALPRIAR